ncbi:MAG TPA: hypothetical protein RMH80_13020 [Polyangiaceae bacterium LLY-WYZ-15_(1-7)]|nr:hypothetical protein [Polyangiaceae bacterium LLY-WYZ-15_(1-7)]
MKPGSMSAGKVWLFALAGALLVAGGSMAHVAVGGLLAAVLGFLSTFLTQSGKGMACGAWALGSVINAIAMFVILMFFVTGVASEAASASGATADGQAMAEAAGSAIGAFAGVVGAIVGFFTTLVPSYVGLFVGAAARGNNGAAPAAA